MKRIFEVLGYLAVIATLLGISLTTLLDDPTKAWVALGTIILLVIFVCIQIYRVAKRHMEMQHPSGILPLSAFVRWATPDGKNITYELFRHIQIKRPCLGFFEHKFMWTGTQIPRCESDIQEIGSIDSIKGENTKSVKLKFKKAKVYNDVEVIHIRMKIDDSDNKSSPFIQQVVKSPISLICFKVELLHADQAYFGKQAVLSRKDDSKGLHATDEVIDSYPFDPSTKSFSCNVNDPEPGYAYRVSWDRP